MEKRQIMYQQLENNQKEEEKIDDKDICIINRIGEPPRIYNICNNKFIHDNIYNLDFYKKDYVGLPVWDLWMYKFHSLIKKFLPYDLRLYIFELIPPSFRLINSSESICDEIKPGIDLYFWCFLIDIILLIWVLLFYTQMAEPRSIDEANGGG